MDLVHRYRPYGISVTDLSAQLWCEKQFEFSLTRGRKKTVEMKEGNKVHENLHEEIVDIVEVKPVTREDRFALKVYNSLVGLDMLDTDGMAREVQVWGRVNSLFVSGIVDEMYRNGNSVAILDTKTRKQKTLPSEPQKKTTRFQMMIYRHLLDSIISGNFLPADLIRFYRFDASSRVTNEFKSQLEKVSGSVVTGNLLKLSEMAFEKLRGMESISDKFEVRYVHQETGDQIGYDRFRLNRDEFIRNCNFVEEFWLGKRKAVKVDEDSKWKCGFCEFRKICTKSMNRLDGFF